MCIQCEDDLSLITCQADGVSIKILMEKSKFVNSSIFTNLNPSKRCHFVIKIGQVIYYCPCAGGADCCPVLPKIPLLVYRKEYLFLTRQTNLDKS